MGYDQHYAGAEALFGQEHEKILEDFLPRLHATSLLLDIGAGQGRNTFFAAAEGQMVHALEPSAVGRKAIAATAAEQKLNIKIFSAKFGDFQPPVSAYDGVMVFGLVPDLEWPGIRSLQQFLGTWSKPGTLLWITGFTTQDPSYLQRKAEWRESGTNVFVSPTGRVRTYLDPGQILELFPQWKALHHWEGLGPWHRHGNSPQEQHVKFEAVLQRR